MHLLRCFADRGFRSDDLHVSRHDFPKLHPDSAISAPFFLTSGEFIMFNLMGKLRTQGALQSRLSSHSRAHARIAYRRRKSPVSTCNAGWRALGPSSLLPAADRLPLWAPQ